MSKNYFRLRLALEETGPDYERGPMVTECNALLDKDEWATASPEALIERWGGPMFMALQDYFLRARKVNR